MKDEKKLATAEAVYLDASALLKLVLEEPPEDEIVRLLIYGGRVPCFTSRVAFGELIARLGRRKKQKLEGGAFGYILRVRAMLSDFDMGAIGPAEPPTDRFAFIQKAENLCERHTTIGGGDIWHLLAVSELRTQYPRTILLAFDKDLLKTARAEAIDVVDGHDLDPVNLVNALKEEKRWKD